MSSPGSIPSENRFSPISQDDHAGFVWIAALLATIYSVLAIGLRTYIKRDCFGVDDWVCAAATLVGMGSFVAIFVALSQGFGKSSTLLDATALQDIGQSIFSSRIVLIVATCLSKSSTAFLIRRLFSQDMQVHRILCEVGLGIIALWGVGSIITLSIRCDARQLVEPDGLCASQLTRWQFIGIYDAVTELLIVLLSFALIYRLQMRIELKLRVILAFIFRLPLVPLAIVHLHFVGNSIDDGDISLSLTPAVILEAVILGYSLISATIPNLKGFIMSFDTALMMDISHKLTAGKPASAPSDPASCPLGSNHSNKAPRLSDIEAREDFTRRLRPERLKHTANIQHDARWSMSGGDISLTSLRATSQDRIIRRDVQWDVETFSPDDEPQHSPAHRQSMGSEF